MILAAMSGLVVNCMDCSPYRRALMVWMALLFMSVQIMEMMPINQITVIWTFRTTLNKDSLISTAKRGR